jgi:hypothetical protein
VRAAAQRPAGFANLDEYPVFVIAFRGAVASNAWAAIIRLEGVVRGTKARISTQDSGEMDERT